MMVFHDFQELTLMSRGQENFEIDSVEVLRLKNFLFGVE